MSETISAEDKAKQIFEATKPEDDLTDLEEFNILEGKGIEYVLKKKGLPDLVLYVRPLTLAEHRIILELQSKKNLTELENQNIIIDLFVKFFDQPKEILEDYMTADDITNIFGLFACALYEGKKMFSKKKLDKKLFSLAVKTLRNTMMNRG